MAKERYKIIPAVYLILRKNNEILMSRRLKTGFQDGKFSFIAGHLDGDESFRQAPVREAKEEADIKIKENDLELVYALHRSKKGNDWERIDLYFATNKWIGEIKNNEPEKCSELTWFDLEKIPENTIEYIKKVIDDHKKGLHYSEVDF